ncbi:MAG: amidohydrolase family protein [Frankiaceae bacterium]|jgi:cytosine/adenosine deaminase-related metal-dependent hydrolase
MTVTLHAAPLVLPICAEPVDDGAVAVDGDRVVAVGPAAELAERYPGCPVRSYPGVLTPGLVNAHAHLEYGPSFADLASSGLPFVKWINTLVGRRDAMTADGWLADARGSVRAALAAGTTAVADVITIGPGIAAAAEVGLGGISYVETVGVDDARWPAERDRLAAALAAAPPGRALGLSPHTLYTLDSAVFAAILAMARERGLRLHTHLAESADESEFVLAGTGSIAATLRTIGVLHDLLEVGADRSPTAQLRALGGLGGDLHVAHGVHVDAADRRLLRDAGTPVALCVRSNRILAAGVPPVAAYLAEGNPVAIGTDSLASSPSLDVLAEASALYDVARAQDAPVDGLARRLIEAATVGGAMAMGLDDAGVLRPGGRADLAAFDVPVDSDPYAALIGHGAGRCVATVLGGRAVHGPTVLGGSV